MTIQAVAMLLADLTKVTVELRIRLLSVVVWLNDKS